jgi:ubiquitin-activating enzyme E1
MEKTLYLQSLTYGIEANTKLMSGSVLIYGLDKGLSTEISKNLCQSQIKNIYLCDNNNVTEQDLETGYYYSKEKIGSSRSITLAINLSYHYPCTVISAVKNYRFNQDVTIVVNQSVEIVKEISEYCRSKSIKLIVVWSKGISGTIFVDAGENHIITDKTDKDIDPVQIVKITELGKVECSYHEYQTGDFITFSNLYGTNLDSLQKEWEIIVHNKTSFELKNFDIKNFVFLNGTANIIKKQSTINHQSFDTNVSDNLAKTFIEIYSNDLINQLPPLWSNEDFMIEHKICLPDQAKLFHHELIPIVSIFGSIAASETIKLITNRYIPISQWFSWTDESLIPKKPIDYLNSETSYGLFYGLELEEKLRNSKWLLVGLESLGSEHLKNLALMNIKNVIISDFDQSKIDTIENIKKIKPDMSIKCNFDKVGLDNTKFTDSIVTKITGVMNTLENTKRFIDEQCFKYSLPLFESNTNKTKGNTFPVIPFITDTYSASNEPDTIISFPLCTIKSFPNDIKHTIEWAIELFEFFKRAPLTINKYIDNPLYLDTLEENEKKTAEEDINLFTIKYPIKKDGLEKCRLWAIEIFNENYYYSINKLLESFPSDHEVIEGVPFWSGGKKCPKPIMFDITNQEHLNFIDITSELLYKCSGPDSTYISQEFNYDNDLHIKWITSTSNMRALNYSIPTSDDYITKKIVGKIIPVIPTTTSCVSGLILLEMLKYLIGYDQIKYYKTAVINLTDSSIFYTLPKQAQMIEIGGKQINSWTKFEYINDTTLDEFKKYYEKVFDTIITMIVIDTTMIYAEFLDSDILTRNLSSILCEHFNTSITPNNISINLLCNEDDKDIPIITINL